MMFRLRLFLRAVTVIVFCFGYVSGSAFSIISGIDPDKLIAMSLTDLGNINI